MTSVALAYLRLAHLRAAERAFVAAHQAPGNLLRTRGRFALTEARTRVARDFWARRREIAAAQRDLHAALDAQMAEAA